MPCPIARQVTYSFCKEFIALLLHYAHFNTETRIIDILIKLFQKVPYLLIIIIFFYYVYRAIMIVILTYLSDENIFNFQ